MGTSGTGTRGSHDGPGGSRVGAAVHGPGTAAPASGSALARPASAR